MGKIKLTDEQGKVYMVEESIVAKPWVGELSVQAIYDGDDILVIMDEGDIVGKLYGELCAAHGLSCSTDKIKDDLVLTILSAAGATELRDELTQAIKEAGGE